MGHSTSGVILSTVRLAADLDYHLIVVEDGCADRDEEVHSLLMEKVFPRQGTVVSSGRWWRRWQRCNSNCPAKKVSARPRAAAGTVCHVSP